MRSDLDDIDNLFCSSPQTADAVVLDVIRQLMFLGLFNGSMVETNDGGVKIEVEVSCSRISNILGQPKLFRQEHENTR